MSNVSWWGTSVPRGVQPDLLLLMHVVDGDLVPRMSDTKCLGTVTQVPRVIQVGPGVPCLIMVYPPALIAPHGLYRSTRPHRQRHPSAMR